MMLRTCRGARTARSTLRTACPLLIGWLLYCAPDMAQAQDHMLAAPEIERLSGNYELPDGRVAFLRGWQTQESRPQRVFLEVDGRRHRLRPLSADAFVTPEGDTLRLVERGGAISGLAWTAPDEGAETFARRVEPYTEHAIDFSNGGISLSGSLLIPRTPGPHPAVVFVHGSGPDWRESYRDLADRFARNGIASLIYDKRGVARSEGDWRLASFEDLADDAIAGVERLRAHPEIDPSRVGLWGISQGGWILPLAAQRSAHIAFIIPVSASGVAPGLQEMWRIGNNLRYRELSPAIVAIGMKANHLFYSLRDLEDRGWMTLSPGIWFRSLDPWLDPAGIWEQVDQPVLGIWGEIDGMVPVSESVDIVRDALDRGGNRAYTLRVFPSAEHNIRQAVEGFQHEPLPEIVYAEGYVESMTRWIHELPESGSDRQIIRPEAATKTRLAWHGAALAPTPAFGRAIVQLPLLVALTALFLGASAGPFVLRAGRRKRNQMDSARRKTADRLTVVAGLLGLVTVVGWVATVGLALFETGSPLIGGHPISLLVARAAAIGASGVLTGMVIAGASRWKRGEFTAPARIGYVTLLAGSVLFVGWSWYWRLFPWLN